MELGYGLACIVKEIGRVHFFSGKIAREKDFPEFVDHFLDRGGKMDGFVTNMGKTGGVGHGCHDLVNHLWQFLPVTQYGFPVDVSIDVIKLAVDDELSLRVTNFEVLK